jgi:imidazolonepropionase-like amidohydrolase
MKALALCSIVLACAPAVLPAETIAIEGAKVYTLVEPAGRENTTILIRDGRIEYVGSALPSPPGARVIDAHGRVITPGLMNAATQLALGEVLGASDTMDRSVSSGSLGAAFDIQYAVNPNSVLLARARADGLTRAAIFPGGSAAAPFAGAGALLRLDEGAEIIERPKAAMFVVSGYSGSKQAGGSRSASWILLRNALDEAKRFGAPVGPGAPRDQLLNHVDIEALLPVVQGRMPLVISASRESDLRQCAALALDYKLRVIILGGAEAWRVAALLAARNIAVILDPSANLPISFDEIGARLDNAAILQRAGVLIAMSVPANGIHLSYNAGLSIREAAGLAVANGLPWIEALKALTLNAGRIWGIDDHYGSIAAGKDADLVVWDDDPLEPSSSALMVFIRGREVSLRSRQTELRDRYSPHRSAEAWPPAYR